MIRLFCILIILLPLKSVASDDIQVIFNQKIIEFLRDKFGDNNLNFDINYESDFKLKKILDGDVLNSLEFTYFSKRTRSFKLKAIVDDGKKIEIFGKFTKFYTVPVSNRTIKINEILSETDYKIIKVKSLNQNEAPITDINKIIGKKTKNIINVGRFFYERDLKNPPVIKEGDVITMQYSSGPIVLKTIGIALSGGAVGEKIRVKNEKTGIAVFGEIFDKNLVIVGEND